MTLKKFGVASVHDDVHQAQHQCPELPLCLHHANNTNHNADIRAESSSTAVDETSIHSWENEAGEIVKGKTFSGVEVVWVSKV